MTSGSREVNSIVLALGASLLAAAVSLWLNASLAFSWSVSLILTLFLALGCIKNGSLGPFRWYFGAALAAWLVAFSLMHWLPAAPDRLVLGLPPATAVSVYGLWLAPLLLVTLPYAIYFDRFIMTEADWQTIAPFERPPRD